MASALSTPPRTNSTPDPRVRPNSPSGRSDLASSITFGAASNDGVGQENPTRMIVDHQGAGRVVRQPDGTVIWEALSPIPVPDIHPPSKEKIEEILRCAGRALLKGARMGLCVGLFMGAAVGYQTTVMHVKYGIKKGFCLTSKELTRVVCKTVTSAVAGSLSGAVCGPLVAVGHLACAVWRPVVFGYGAAKIATGIMNRRGNVPEVIKNLDSADDKKVEKALCAIRRHARSEKFTSDFCMLSGMERLVQLTGSCQDSPLLIPALQAIDALLHEHPDAQDKFVGAGGVPLMVPLLALVPTVQQLALEVLVHLAVNPVAQDQFRQAGGVQLVMDILKDDFCPAATRTALAVLMRAVQDPAIAVQAGQDGGVGVIASLLMTLPPKSEAYSQASGVLVRIARSDARHVGSLKEVAGLTPVLEAALSSGGRNWWPGKHDIMVLLSMTGRPEKAPSTKGPESVASERGTQTRDELRTNTPDWVDISDD